MYQLYQFSHWLLYEIDHYFVKRNDKHRMQVDGNLCFRVQCFNATGNDSALLIDVLYSAVAC